MRLVWPLQDLMRELDDKEGAIRSVQDRADQLLGGNHPARLTIEVQLACVHPNHPSVPSDCTT